MRKLTILFALLTLNVGLWAQETQSVNYIDADGQEQTVTATVITNETSALNEGWYVVTGDNVSTGSLTCNGAVHLILADGAKLTATGDDTGYTPGIQVSGDGNSLTIYGQSAQTGQLIANGGDSGAGIGGGQRSSGSNITINGGVVKATGGRFAAGIGGGMLNSSSGMGPDWYGSDGFNITINGGTVTAKGGNDGAGIGGGMNGSGYDITINGGTVTANGVQFGAGIGGGQNGNGSNIIINDGTVTANGGQWGGAGIGGGQNGNGSNIIINDGTVTANGGQSGGAGIGGGEEGYGSNITLNGGTITANGVDGGAGIGGGKSKSGVGQKGDGFNITINGGKVTANGAGLNASGIGAGMEGSGSNIIIAATLLVKADASINPPTTVIPNTGADLASTLKGKQYVTTEPIVITYGEYITVSPEFESGANVAYGTEITFTAADRSAVVDDSYYEFLGFYKESTFYTPITEGVSGRTCTLTVTEAAISIYAKYRQHFSVPYIDADGQERTADAIEIADNTLNAGWYVVRGSNEDHGALTCNGEVHLILADGAKLTATGKYNRAGIQVSGDGNSLTIYGQATQSGQLFANGDHSAAGIGGGDRESGSDITINGGTVTANGGIMGAGIGGGWGGSGSNITINGGTVTAKGGDDGAGIGGGYGGYGSNITINGGTVTANGREDGAGIGGGKAGYGSNIFVVPELIVRAGNDNPPATVIAADRTAETNIAGDLAGKRYATARIPQGGIVTYGGYITVSPQFASGDRVASDTVVTFTAADRWAENYEFLGFYKESTFENKITNGVSGLTYTVTVLDDDISVYAKYEGFIPTPYIDANGQEQSTKATEITNETTTLSAGWYVVSGNDVRTGSITCNGAVHLILADGTQLTATGGYRQAGVTVSGNGNSLTIYGQSAQSGRLIANGGTNAAGIGGGNNGSGSNIIINGGNVIANGGEMDGEGAAGIGGGWSGSGSNITINGGTVTANGGQGASGIGGGCKGYGSNIKVATALTVYTDNTNPPTFEILHANDYDIAPNLAGKRYAVVKDDMTGIKDSAIAAINAAIEGVTNEDIIAIATNAINAINAAINVREITIIKEQALAAIASAKAIYNSAFGEMGTPCTDCPAVDVTKGTTTIRLYSPEKVEFRKME